ncbi:lysosome-associated membrane glycoprotein 2 isoform X2 [Stegostoma tigrinum]|uniref:lysosome-associated membrane glycoprotein 2 isoform X2 n=1 Tax=Stegostoma tigrinum TaxID=3053191 RepID=UPI00202B9D93|nr:lysosome-associated membrane glycoprotein 2 isoform X2 [Stegostoma tigrinum]
MSRYVVLHSAALLVAALSLIQAVKIEVHGKDNKTCIYAVLSVNFTVLYEGNGTMENATFQLPDSLSTNGSTCGGNSSAPLLNMGFGTGHSLSLNFSRTDGKFSGDVLTFTYNTSDAKLFPGAINQSMTCVKLVVVNSLMESVPLNTIYTCRSVKAIASEAVVMIFWHVGIQAFVVNGTISKNESFCKADVSTTVTPITTQASSTVAPIPTEPSPDLPAVGNYTIKNGSDPCLLANMGLQLNITNKDNQTHVININSSSTASGRCGDKHSVLVLEDTDATIWFHFFVEQAKFFLKEVKVNVTLLLNGSTTTFNCSNGSLKHWQAFVGSSYMCRNEQQLVVTDQLAINTFNVWVQPFDVKNGTFSRAEECSLDDDSILIPIIVGAALAGLIVIVVISYVIGRRRSYAGYQTL